MRVACIGNMNNNVFSLVRFLPDRGIDAHLLILNNDLYRFDPLQDTYDLSFLEYKTYLSWGIPEKFSNVPRERIRQDLADYDFIIACGFSPAFIEKAGKEIDIFAPFGGDIYSLPFIRLGLNSLRRYLFGYTRSLKKAIRKSKCINQQSVYSALLLIQPPRMRPSS